jgi:hypothetical protein
MPDIVSLYLKIEGTEELVGFISKDKRKFHLDFSVLWKA